MQSINNGANECAHGPINRSSDLKMEVVQSKTTRITVMLTDFVEQHYALKKW